MFQSDLTGLVQTANAQMLSEFKSQARYTNTLGVLLL